MSDEVFLDGSRGEGGGQVLRTALALSLATSRPFRIESIRAGRKKPGLLRQHLTGVRLAAQVGEARVRGAALGSRSLVFAPRACRAGTHHVRVGTAGSTALVAQTVLPALLFADGRSAITVEGGTHALGAPPFEFLERVWLRVLRTVGVDVRLELVRPGFYPAGGGELRVRVTPWRTPEKLELLERGARTRVEATALVAHLPSHVAERELAVVAKRLGWPADALRTEARDDAPGPGNALLLTIEHEKTAEVCTGFGARRLRAEAVAAEACEQARHWLAGDEPVGAHLADQLMLPLVLGAGGVYRTAGLTQHARTNIEVIDAFLPGRIETTPSETGGTLVRVRGLREA